jgi:membrane-bound lytic murein transglycosylase D
VLAPDVSSLSLPSPSESTSANGLPLANRSPVKSGPVSSLLNTEPLKDLPDPELNPPAAETNLWIRITKGFQFSQTLANKRINREKRSYSKHPKDLARTLQRSEPFLFYIVEEAEKRGIPMEIALLPVVESAFNPFAYSPLSAAGIWQFIPGTGKYYGLKQTWWYDGRRDVTASTHAAFDYLQALAKRFDGDWLLALAAYNSGAGRVSKAIKRNKRNNQPIDYWNLRLPKETKAYVPRLIAIAQIVARPEKYGLVLQPIANQPVFEVAELDSQIDLTKAATLAGMSVDDLYLYNPGFKQWATDPLGPHRLVIPTDRMAKFHANLAKLPKSQRVTWQRYQVKRGDSLSVIAGKFDTSVKALKNANNIKGSIIRTGQKLKIPNRPDHAIASAYPATGKRADTATPRKVYYKVRKGDTLWDISRDYHVSTRKLAKWNNMAPSDILRPGKSLIIWTKPSRATYLASAAMQKNADLRKIDYQVRKGDSLYRIADRFKVSVLDLLKWNSINARSFLQPGQLLDVFVSD